MKNEFIACLVSQLLENSYNYNLDNFDEARFWKLSRINKFKLRIKKTLMNVFDVAGIFFVDDDFKESSRIFCSLKENLDHLENAYSLLKDECSKKMMVDVFAYKILGQRRFKLSTNNQEYEKNSKISQSLTFGNEFIDINFMGWKLKKFDLKKIGFDLKLFYLPAGIAVTFLQKQYEYGKRTPKIKAEKGDYVFDVGGCWGDTALYFAQEIGGRGKVFTFEFIPSNLLIMEKNINLNKELKNRIEIIKNPIWEYSGEEMYYVDNGPGSTVNKEKTNESAVKIATLSLDDFSQKNNLLRVDFIKMDIEGAELEALKGAENLIRKFRPKLAISIYHKPEHFYQIIEYLNSLNLEYEFFLDHFTIHSEETILFANIS
jgi:FkbM family methyltransferase